MAARPSRADGLVLLGSPEAIGPSISDSMVAALTLVSLDVLLGL